MSDQPHALVLSGGGANAAYEIGVVKALATGASGATDYSPLEPSIYTGTSAGAFNAAILASLSDRPAYLAAAYLEELWLTQVAWGPQHCGNGIYRVRGDVRQLLDPACNAAPAEEAIAVLDDAGSLSSDVFEHAREFLAVGGSLGRRVLSLVDLGMFIDGSPLKRLLEHVLQPEAIRSSSKILRIAVTEWTSGQLRIFRNTDMTDEAAVLIVLASSAIPGFFPPVEVGGEVYVDGGVVMDTPLLPAIQAGAEVIHVIYADPDVNNIPVETLRSTFGSFDRMLTIGKARAINMDADTVRRINQGLDLLELARMGQLPDSVERRAIISAARSIGFASARGVPYKRVQVHRYHPRQDLGGVAGVLNVDHERVAGLIAKGFEDTVSHDCVEAGCIL